MSSSANRRRVFLVSLFSLLSVFPGCVVQKTTTTTVSDVPSAESVDASTDMTAANAASGEVALTSTRSMVDSSDAGVGIEVSEGAGVNQIAIQTKSANPSYEVIKLSSPSRLVIDLAAGEVSSNRSVPISDLEYIQGIRLGSHADKSRIVLDIPEGQEINHSEEVRDGKLIVTLASTAVAPSDMLAQAKIDSDTAADSSSAVAPAANDAMDSEAAVVPVADTTGSAGDTTTAVLPDESAATATGASESKDVVADSSVNTVTLEDGGSTGPRVVAQVDGAPNYELLKTAPSEYVLTVRNSELNVDPSATMIVAPPSDVGIRTVRATKEGTDVLLRIFAQPGTTLEARRSGATITVEPGSEEGMRAQLDPDAAKKGGEEAAAPPSEAATDTPKITVSDKAIGTEGADLNELLGDSSKFTGRLISLDLQDTDIDNALRIIAEVSNLNIVASDDVTGKVTLRLIDVPWDQALDVILKTNGLDKVIEGNVMRIAPVEKLRQERESLKASQQAEEELEPLSVKYLRVSYAKAAEMKPLIETVLSERGTVAYDERSNQLIIKDTKKGLKNVVELVNKIDLRTPQVLLETQIVEASRSLVRELGAELGFNYTASPATGNATGWNFPNSISVGNTGNIPVSSFPASGGLTGGSGISFLFDSADGTRSLDIRLSQLEREGRVRTISRPAVATTNNKPATIKSVEKVRLRLPQGGLSVATGQGAQAQGTSNVATEVVEIGITLDVTPQASPDYYVLLDIAAKSSTFGSRAVDNIPSEIERSATSTVLVSSGQTFALGGIYKISDNDTVDGVPFFKDIPFFGHFFRRTTTNNSDEELLFFITPRIVEGSFDDAAMKAAS